MRSAIIISGLGAIVAAQSSESSVFWDPSLQSSISAALASASALNSQYFATATGALATASFTPEELSSIDSAAFASATSAIGAQSSIIFAGQSSVLSWQSQASEVLGSITSDLASATGSAKESLASASRSITSAIASESNLASQITSGLMGPSSAGDDVANTSTTDNGVAPTARPVIAAGAVGAVGLALLGLL